MTKVFFLTIVLAVCYAKSVKSEFPSRSEMTGKVIKIVDGDTYDLLLFNHTIKRIRMDGIDAPERGMPFYKVAKDYLGKLCFGQNVRIVQTNVDRNGRVIAKSYLEDGNELGYLMIKAGFAWHFKKYSSDEQLANAEISARQKKTGIWLESTPIAPWEWRKLKKTRRM